MKRASWSWLDIAARSLVPCALTVGLVLAAALPVHSAATRAVAPSLPLIAVFWTLSRPELMPAAAVFAIGLLGDVLSGQPIGLGAGVLVGVHAVVTTQRAFFTGKSFGILWLGFAWSPPRLPLGWLLTCSTMWR
ncbi:MAG: rod shape-determining protein MreD [Rhodospirillales bacterium]